MHAVILVFNLALLFLNIIILMFFSGKYWCSTKTDRYGNHVNGQGNYGFCGFCDNPVCGCGCGIDARKNIAQSASVGAGDSISFGAASGNSPA